MQTGVKKIKLLFYEFCISTTLLLLVKGQKSRTWEKIREVLCL